MPPTHAQLIAKANASVAEAAGKVQGDRHRPAYHFLPPAYWINDPNGFIQWKGRFHLFYQHNPYGPLWGNMHWGHAVSDDLATWRHLPIAIAPEPDGPDKDGIFSGCCVDDGGVLTAIYTGVRPEVQCLARADAEGIVFTKEPRNPVIGARPEGMDAGFRDPFVWRENGEWLMLVGSGRRGVGGNVLLYRSTDLVNWTYLHPLLEGRAAESGRMWECPFFFPLEDKHVLVVHPIPLGRPIYMVGTYKDRRFTPEIRGTLDADPGDSYAGFFTRDDKGRTLMMAWVREARPNEPCEAAGWSCCLSLPREVALTRGGRLALAPAAELARLRGRHERHENVELADRNDTLTAEMRSDTCEVFLRARSKEAGPFGLRLRRAPAGEEETAVVFDPWSSTLRVERHRSSLDPLVNRSTLFRSVLHKPGDPLELRVFVDRSVIEVYAPDGGCITARVYPTRGDATGVEAFGRGVTIEQFQAWTLSAEP